MTPCRPPGLYEELVTHRLEAALEEIRGEGWRDEIESLDPAEAPGVLARFVHDLVEPLLGSLTGKGRTTRQLELVNNLVAHLMSAVDNSPILDDDALAPPPRQLLSLVDPTLHGVGEAAAPQRPSIPLASSHLLINGPRDHTVSSEIKRELASADRVDLLVSFLKFSGWRLLRDDVRRFLDRRPGGLRVLTTTYLGATDRKVLDELAAAGAQVRISYDTRRTRLHAKAWLFHRDSGYSTALVGSSNLSAAAITDGLEWNVRLSHVETPQVLRQFQTAFEQYWEEGEFEPYDPAADADRVDQALRSEQRTGAEALALRIDVRPYPFQQEILDRLDAERRRGHTRNLVVAATGTGKTVVAALDYRHLRTIEGPLKLLFVAHRREILDQSLATFRVVLKDGAFGEQLVAGRRPVHGDYVFASIQSLSENRIHQLDPAFYDVVIVDEFHHAAAPTYDRLLNHVRPRYLLGLTATPERADGQPIIQWFDHRLAAELRLWHALDQQLLCPFQYFGIADGTDLSTTGWQAGRYVTAELDNVYTGNHARARTILRALDDTIEDPHAMRALGFCVSIAHAEFMAAQFNAAGIPAAALTTNSNEDTRKHILERLKAYELNIVFAVDIFNEGVDVPEVDTVLFLRPTESATVFLQQLGRGLRLSEGKECLTALDFVGHMHAKFRFDRRFRAILGGTRKQILREVEQGFPRLPPGCAIHLQREAQQAVLGNIKQTLGAGWNALVEDLRGLTGPVSLRRFLTEANVDLTELYAGDDRGWTKLRRQAGHALPPPTPDETPLARAINRLLHVNDPERFKVWRALFDHCAPPQELKLNQPDHRLLFMLASMLDTQRRPLAEQPAVLESLLNNEPLRQEMIELLTLLEDAVRRPTGPLDLPIPAPLQLHADYQLAEIMAAMGSVTPDTHTLVRPREGVYWHEHYRCDLFFITLEKSNRDYSPTTMYDDYPISPTLFHWQSQSTTREDSPTGRRYREHAHRGSHILLFVRRRKQDERRITDAYTFLGPATYESHHGERPMSITWRLHHPMPAELFEEMKVAAG
jgi:superfamily II DNA or RNA helicase/HKD family nuclease